jgi:outer membrane lipoprotein-sorting protein
MIPVPALWLAMLTLASVAQQAAAPTADLDGVLKIMDTAGAKFSTTQADFTYDQYQKVVDETEVQQGTVYFRRTGKAKDVEMKADFKTPDQKFLLYRDAKIQLYQPKADQLTVYNAGNNRTEIESYLVLGFGGSGQDLLNAFDVTYQGAENIGGIATGKLQLIPKSEKVRNTFSKIVLWIDLQRGISVQQQFFQPQGDYRLAKYSAIRVNEKISGDVFQIKTTSKTQTITR